ncbi:hypothetical protein [Pyxidicoccus xibeiensis]|uniref:hypothetical protein n=1 Tax=Pyxidicoccus xibeiensis TaxID=2906759 RepID=UPI0020A79875|nr:hypothetical protein [Pyxidicoccus xibeiensis]MCP3141403.1 hypothetical protein [Pyxidicoccus xibeiensis]
MKISNERGPKVPAQSQGPKSAQAGELDVLKSLETLVKTPGPAADPLLAALQSLTGVAAPEAAPADPVLAALSALTGVQAPTATATQSTARTAFSADAPRAPLSQALLPNSVNPPNEERLFRCFQDAWKSAYGNTKLASTAEREALMKMATDLRNQGKSAVEIEYALLAHIKGGGAAAGAGGASAADARTAATEAFKSTFRREPTPDEARHWEAEAHKLAEKGMDATRIKYALMTPMQQARDKVDPNDRNALSTIAREAFKGVYGREPNPTELKEWTDKAEAMAKDGKDATTIKYALMTPMQQARDKVDPNDRNALNTLAREAFKSVFGREPNPTELKEWADKAEAMAKDGKDATTIKYALITPMQQARDGGGRTDDAALVDLIKNAFRDVLRDAYREPSPREEREWLKVAQKLRDEGKLSATAIKHMLMAEVRVAYGNL